MDQSIQYNLRNPAFVEDIGHSVINQMYPVTTPGTPAMMNPAPSGTQINPGQPRNDSYESDKVKKERKFIHKVLLLCLMLAGGTIILKRGRSIGTSIGSTCKNLWNKIIRKNNPISNNNNLPIIR